MKEIARLGIKGPTEARGRVQLDFTDPITGKVKDRATQENHVFLDMIRNVQWIRFISGAYLLLNNDDTAVDPNMPFVRGDTIGYGRPSLGSLNTYRGAYNAANQVLARIDMDKVYWKFQYDFTPAQANGTIRNVGLSRQINVTSDDQLSNAFSPIMQWPSGEAFGSTSDGRRLFSISAAGVINVRDIWLGTTTDIDVSALVGAATYGGFVAFNPSDSTYYVFVYNVGGRTCFKFANPAFTSVVSSHNVSNLDVFATVYPCYVYGNYAFLFVESSIYRFDFVNNTAKTTIINSAPSSTIITNEGSYSGFSTHRGACPMSDRYVTFGGYESAFVGGVFDMSTSTVAAVRKETVGYSGYATSRVKHPLLGNDVPCVSYGGRLWTTGAISSLFLSPARTKTSDVGMTATYELEVYW